jgi:hypothetical protein
MLDAQSNSPADALRIAASNDGSHFVVVWSQLVSQTADGKSYHYAAALLDTDLHFLSPNIDLGTIQAASAAFALIPRGNGFAVIARSSDSRVFAWTLDASAQVTGERTLATGIGPYATIDAAANGDQVSIITGTTELEWSAADVVTMGAFSGRIVLGVADSLIAIWDPTGIAVYSLASPSSPAFRVEVRQPHSVSAAVMVQVTSGTYTAFTTDDGFGQSDLFGALNSGPIDIVASSTSLQTAPAIASDADGESLVVWREYSTRSRLWQLLARMVDRAGVPQGEVTTIWTQAPYFGGDIFGMLRVTSDGTRFLVTYGMNTIRGQFVSSGGTLIGTSFVITQSAFTFLSYLGWHDATWNGQRYLVTWVEGSAGRFITDQHVVGAFVGNDGSVGSPFRIGDAASYSQASSPAGDTLLTAFAPNGFKSFIARADGGVAGPFFAVPPDAIPSAMVWNGSAFVTAGSTGGWLQTSVIQADGSITVLPRSDFKMWTAAATLDAGGVLITGDTLEGVAMLQLDANAHPMGGPVLIAPGAKSFPANSRSPVVTYTRAGDRNITRVFVQRPASIIRHRAAVH